MSAPETAASLTGAGERWTGFAGALLLAAGAAGAGVLPKPDPLADAPVLSVLRSNPGRIGCIVLAAFGLAVLVRAWWRLRPGRVTAGHGLTATAALWAAPLALAPPLFSRDVYAYAAQGLVWARGLNPYTTGPSALLTDRSGVWSSQVTGWVPDGIPGWVAGWVTSVSPTWQSAPAPYGPLFFFVAGGAARGGEAAGGNLIVTLALLRLAAIGGVVALAVLVPRLALACGVDPDAARWLAVANPFLLVHLISGVHNDALMLPLLVGGLLMAVPRAALGAAGRPWLDRAAVAIPAAGALIGLAAAIKIVAVVVLPFAALILAPRLRGRLPVVRAGAGAVLAALVVFAGLSAVAGLDTGWIAALRATAGVSIQWTSVPTGWGLAANWVAHAFGVTTAKAGLLAATRAAGSVLTAVLLVLLWVWTLRRDRRPATVIASCGWALLAVAVLGAAVHPWYVLWTVVPVAAAGSARARHRLGIASAALAFLVLPDGYSLARVTEVPGVLLDLILTGAAVVWAVRRARARRTRTAAPAGFPAPEPAEPILAAEPSKSTA